MPGELSASQVSLLEAFEELLVTVAIPGGFISRNDLAHVRERHILDSLRAIPCVPHEARVCVDLGSGAGLPGVPLAIARQDLRVVLAEARTRRGAFLEMVAERLKLGNLEVAVGDMATLRIRADVCLARAFASPHRTWEVGRRLLGPTGVLIYFAGRSWTPQTADSPAGPGPKTEICGPPVFPWQGPIVIMRRHTHTGDRSLGRGGDPDV